MPEGTDTSALQLGLILTAAGAGVFATFLTGFVGVLKNLPGLGAWLENGHELAAIMLLAAIVVVLAGIDQHVNGLAGYFGLAVAWYAVTELAVAIHDRAKPLVRALTPGGGNG